jgi:hypothetical protein
VSITDSTAIIVAQSSHTEPETDEDWPLTIQLKNTPGGSDTTEPETDEDLPPADSFKQVPVPDNGGDSTTESETDDETPFEPVIISF